MFGEDKKNLSRDFLEDCAGLVWVIGGGLYRPIGTTEEEDPVSRVIDFVLGRGLHSHYVYP